MPVPSGTLVGMSVHDDADVLEVNGRPVGYANSGTVQQYQEAARRGPPQDVPEMLKLPVCDFDLLAFMEASNESTAANQPLRFRLGDRDFQGVIDGKPPVNSGGELGIVILRIVTDLRKP